MIESSRYTGSTKFLQNIQLMGMALVGKETGGQGADRRPGS